MPMHDGHRERRRRQHHGLGGREGPEVAAAGGVGDAPRGQRHHPQTRRPGQPGAAGDDQRERRAGTRSQARGDRAAGPTAKRRTSPQLGAVAPERGSPKMATDPLPASAVPTTQGRARTSATTTACTATDEHPPGRLAGAHEERAQHPGHRHDEHHGQHGRREGRRGRDDGAEEDDLSGGPAPPVRSGLDGVGSHAGGPGQAQRDEREGGVGHQPVPAARAECAVGQREPEVTDDRHDTGAR